MNRKVSVFAANVVEETKSGFLDDDKKKGARLGWFKPDFDVVKSNLEAFMKDIDDLLPSEDVQSPLYQLEAFDVAVSINGKGQVGFLGTGGELGGSATLTIRFKRNVPAAGGSQP